MELEIHMFRTKMSGLNDCYAYDLYVVKESAPRYVQENCGHFTIRDGTTYVELVYCLLSVTHYNSSPGEERYNRYMRSARVADKMKHHMLQSVFAELQNETADHVPLFCYPDMEYMGNENKYVRCYDLLDLCDRFEFEIEG